MSAYLEEHLPHLQSLHAQLALPATALSSDQARLESAIRNSVTALIREREVEVDGWKDAIAGEKKEISGLARAVGDRGRNVLAVGRRESFEDEPLPSQHGKLVEQNEALKKLYTERLQQIQNLQATLEVLSNLLGPPFEPAQPLQPIASSSKSVLPPAPAWTSLTRTTGMINFAGGYRRSASGGTLAQDIAESKVEVWMDVGEEVTESLSAAVQKAMDERLARIQQLSDHFRDLLFLHAELVLPPIPLAHPHHFPIHLLAARRAEERPGAHVMYEKTLSRYIGANQSAVREDEAEEKGLKGLEGVEPEVGLINWAEELVGRWTDERTAREARIQELYDQVEPLWYRLEIEQAVMDLFMDMNRGCGETVIKAYELELERILEIRRSSLSSFVVSARKEIELLWSELMLSEDEKGDFGPLIDDDYTEELLHVHEEEAERLRAEVESKSTLLPKVRQWHALKLDEEELERNATNPNRFSARGGAMLREEKLRKRVGLLLPKIETDLLTSLPAWEAANSRPFMVQGERVVDKIYDAREAKEMVKEAKKRAKQGLAPAKTVLIRQTPAVGSQRTQSSTSTSRKREAPTPTPIGTYQSNPKRQRTGPPSTIRALPKPTRTASASSNDHRDPGSSPTPVCHLPRPISGSYRTLSGQSASSVFSTTSTASDRTRVGGISWSAKPQILGVEVLAKAEGRRPKRESFKPRQSIVGGFLAAKATAAQNWGLVVEEDEGGEDDVF